MEIKNQGEREERGNVEEEDLKRKGRETEGGGG